MDERWDCVVVGAGAAGLSAAMVLGRARRRTLVVDAGGQSNLASAGIGGLLGQDGRAPADFYAAAHEELAAYPTVVVRFGEVVAGTRRDDGFVLELGDGSRERARRVLLATGMDYRYPALSGVRERWGRSVFHCPFCHGWEHRDEPLGVLDRGGPGVHRAMLLRAWSDDVTLLTDGPTELDAEQTAQLRMSDVVVDDRRVAQLRGPQGTLTAVEFSDGGERPLGGLLVPVMLHQRSSLAEQLGAVAAEPGPVVADALQVDAMLQTTAAGVVAAGDVCAQMPSVANAIAAGATAAVATVRGLMLELRSDARAA